MTVTATSAGGTLAYAAPEPRQQCPTPSRRGTPRQHPTSVRRVQGKSPVRGSVARPVSYAPSETSPLRGAGIIDAGPDTRARHPCGREEANRSPTGLESPGSH
jgi:hypothetical protein